MRHVIWSGFAVWLLAAVAAQGVDRVVVGDFSSGATAKGLPKGWQLEEKSGRAHVRVGEVEGHHAVNMRSTNTSFSLQRTIKADLKQTPFLTWKWKVTRLPESGDFRKSATDDQAAQLFVAFNRSEAIVYLWDSSAPEGLMADAPAPPFMSVKAVVVRSSTKRLGQWLSETRNVWDDYKKLYGRSQKAPVVFGVRLQINTQHTRSAAESYFADVSFKSEPDIKSVSASAK